MRPVRFRIVRWPSRASKWSIVSAAAAILVAVIAAAVAVVSGDPRDAPVSTPPVTTDGPAATQGPAVVPTTEAATPTGVSSGELRLRIARLAAELAGTPVVVRTEVGEARLTMADLGIALDIGATFDAVKRRRSADADAESASMPGWSALPTDPQFSERWYRVERSAAHAVLGSAFELELTATPPSVIVVDSTLAVSLGEPGGAVDADAVVDEVLEGIAASLSRMEIEADIERAELPASATELGQATDEAQERYGRSLVVSYQDESRELTLETIADWLILDYEASPPVVTLDESAVVRYLEEIFAAQSAPFAAAEMEVVDGVPRAMANDGGAACCADTAGAMVVEALASRVESPVALPSRPAVSREAQAYLESLGMVELVATFTTGHACCESRVTNIQRFADLMRGVVVGPGRSLSLNGHVGRRTEAKGFVEGGFIEHGVVIDDIGGGVSQFATTIFNALIRAGMTIDEYQMHSLYLSRYPYGLDPTISYPKPDLRFTNPTPHGVLIWPSYTDTSITVDLYSTSNVEVTISESEEEMRDFCRRVRTEVTRAFAGGQVELDTFWARYRPEQGRNCDGARSVPRQCIDPLLASSPPGQDGRLPVGMPKPTDDAEAEVEVEVVDDGSERADGTIVECPPLECTEKPGERDTGEPRYPDDPCLGVDLEALARQDESPDGEAGSGSEAPDSDESEISGDSQDELPDDDDANADGSAS
ncbi:VanW family protein [Candidatus Poriferisodalis sp.]|uniref:VanW family protein n=1 Tax=Candidatus Poriferisodalis sp. TaxID=3101277 RepID=UPI003B0232B1